MLSTFKKMLEAVADEGAEMFARVKDKVLFRRIVSACYLVSRGNGEFKAEEKTGLAKVIGKELPQFSIGDILEVISQCVSKIEFDETMGEMEILDDIGGATGDDATVIMRTSCYIGAIDGDFDDNEKAIARKIASRLKIDPGSYGL